MPTSVEKTYGDALFELIKAETPDKLGEVAEQLTKINALLAENPEYVKLMNNPTVQAEVKAKLVREAFDGKADGYVVNFVALLAEKERLGYFARICDYYRGLYNDEMGIAEITVTTALPLTEQTRARVAEKMAAYTGKRIILREKTDKALIGGIIVDIGTTRLDGSVKTRLETMKKDIAGIIA